MAPGKPMQNAFIESFMYRRPAGARGFDNNLDIDRVSCIPPFDGTDTMVGGPVGDCGSRPHVALKALRAFSIPAPPLSITLSFALTP